MMIGSGGLTFGLIIISYIPAGIALLKVNDILLSFQPVIFALAGFTAAAALAVSARALIWVEASPIETEPLVSPNPEPSMVTVEPTEPAVVDSTGRGGLSTAHQTITI